jgi:biopolymer transport protein ExbB/TolQ
MSIYGLIMQADVVGKSVIALLVIASVICWAIMLEKFIRVAILRSNLRKLEAAAAEGLDYSDVSGGLTRKLLEAARLEAEDGASRNEGRSELRGRLERSMRTAMKAELQRIETGLPFLATIGSAGPFIGLFGTVWGIMNSFTAIAQQKDTSLAVVAPGIAEALFATALGLGAAIPAVMAYNAIAVTLGRSANRANTAIAGLARSLSKPQTETYARPHVEPLRAGKTS